MEKCVPELVESLDVLKHLGGSFPAWPLGNHTEIIQDGCVDSLTENALVQLVTGEMVVVIGF